MERLYPEDSFAHPHIYLHGTVISGNILPIETAWNMNKLFLSNITTRCTLKQSTSDFNHPPLFAYSMKTFVNKGNS